MCEGAGSSSSGGGQRAVPKVQRLRGCHRFDAIGARAPSVGLRCARCDRALRSVMAGRCDWPVPLAPCITMRFCAIGI
eukprot:3116178-Alexandrium_andersonii.AAC.1